MILIVGGDGLIGCELHRLLVAAGENVLATTRRCGSEAIHLDLAQADAFSVPPGVRTAVVCAGIGSLQQCADDPEETARINVEGSATVARKVAATGGTVVALSTNLVLNGARPGARADEPVGPCCEYGRQKAALEEQLQGSQFACVRLTKVMETLRPRFRNWKGILVGGGEVSASAELRFSPVPLRQVCAALAELVRNFQPGIFHVSGDRDFSYQEAVAELAGILGADGKQVRADRLGGVNLFSPVPRFATLGRSVPSDCSRWSFSPSSDTLAGFLRSL